MDDPVAEIEGVIQTLCTAPPSIQRDAVEKYFTPTASFTHPFCRTGSFNGSRWFIVQIYRWYKILSPRIDVHIDSISFDPVNLILYVGIHQTFRIWAIPFYEAQPSLVTVLQLTNHSTTKQGLHQAKAATRDNDKPESSSFGLVNRKHSGSASGNNGGNKKKYYIQSQNDLYQTSEWIKFVVPFGIGVTILMGWQFVATILCTIGAIGGYPITWLEENVIGGNRERIENQEALGAD